MKDKLFRLLARCPAYLQIVRMGAHINFSYKFSILFQLAGVIFQIYLLKVIWTAIYKEHGTLNHVDLPLLISYLTLANLQTWIFTPTITHVLQQRIRTGEIALDIAKPISFPFQLIAQQVGSTLSLIPFLLVTLPLAYIAGAISLPVSIGALLFYLISCIMAFLIMVLIGVLMGLISLWTFEMSGINVLYRFVNQLLGGSLIPLWLFPPFLRIVATILPFQIVAFLPISIYLGQIQGIAIINAFFTQFIWIVILSLLTATIWKKAQRYIVIQGG